MKIQDHREVALEVAVMLVEAATTIETAHKMAIILAEIAQLSLKMEMK